MKRILLAGFLICLGYSMTWSQSLKSVKGYLCKNVEDSKAYSIYNPYGRMGIRTGNHVDFYRLVIFGIPMELTRYFNHAWPSKDRIGIEYLVKYKVVDREKQAISISRTGRIKKVQPYIEE